MKWVRLLFIIAVFLPAYSAFAQTGKVSGEVTDAATGEPLPGVNVSLDGTTQGAVTDEEGFYSILNVRPGTYAVRASFIGFTPMVHENVRVNVDLTAEVNFQLQQETVGLDEMVVVAQRPVVQRDVSASIANLSSEEIENLPVTDIEKVVGLQAGFERGLTIRGSGGDQVQFMVDGFSTQSGRDNIPFTGISYTAVDEVQVQTGGFNAEYGNVRSGLVNVVTKDPPRDRYLADVIFRYSTPSQKHFGPLPNDPDTYWTRPFFDPDVAFVGTKAGTWDSWTQNQYREFQGWNSLSESFASNTDGDPSNDVTPEQMQEAFKWYLRKDFEIDQPDYELDGTIAGPIPGISRYLGDLRFMTSYRQTQEAYIVPMVRDVYEEKTFQGKLLSNLSEGMKLMVHGMWSSQQGINTNEQGSPNMFTGEMPFYPWDNEQAYLSNNLNGDHIFATHWRNPMDITRAMLGAEFTHTLSATTYYEVQLQRTSTDYSTFTTEPRDPRVLNQVGSIQLTEEPFGWVWQDSYDQLGVGFRNGGHWFSARDSSNVSRWRGSFDLTTQINRFSTMKVGAEYVLSNFDTNYGEIDPAHPHHANPLFVWNRTPQQGAVYAQNKLEFRGMVANIGLRLDYFHAGDEWYAFSPFDRAFSSQIGRDKLEEALEKESIERQVGLSPRLGVSFPITDNSKLYFNYGHFRSMLNPVSLFTIEEINTGAVQRIGNPNHPMPKTVAYELGYEQNLFNLFLLRIAGYYRDLSNQPRNVTYTSIDGEVNYQISKPFNYADIRGAEITLTKNRGSWIRGFINYTYMARKSGNFGFSNVFESLVEMQQYMLTATDHYQNKPVPEPYARFNIEILIPRQFGPEVIDLHPLSNWRVNLLGEWRRGQPLTWTGQQRNLVEGRSPVRGLQNNVRWRDFYNLDLRLSKSFDAGFGRAQFFVDVTNVLNLRRLNRYGIFMSDLDEESYLKSLHLPEDTFEDLEGGDPYLFIPGSDKPGDFRREGIEFVPIEVVSGLPESGQSRPLYYNVDDQLYYQWDDGAFRQADERFVEQVLDDKAYIDMPNNTSYLFLNPRNVFFGIRLSF